MEETEILRAVSALAVIKVNWDENKDYIANFVSIVAHCVGQGEHEEVSLSETQELIEETFGLRIPLGPLETILHRMAREGLLRRRNGVYARDSRALAYHDLGSEREQVLRQHNHLVDLLAKFAAAKGREWSEGQAERALLAYVEGLAEPILGAALNGESIAELPRVNSEGSVVTNQFVLNLCHKEPQAFEYLVTIVKGTMLANVLFLPEAFSGGQTRLSEIEIYLDTPVVLRGLGYAEAPYCQPARELLDLLVGEGARLRVFEHTLHEVEGVLDGAAAAYRTGDQKNHVPGDVVDYFASKGLSRSDVDIEISELSERLAARRIEARPTPAHGEQYALSEPSLEARLTAEIPYARHSTMVKDLDSLSAIYRLRGGSPRRRIEGAGAILVTTNHKLAHVSRLFFRETLSGSSVPLCVSDYNLAALAWLMNPSQAPDLPRRQIIAISYAALNPPDEIWRLYLAEVRKLKDRGALTEEQVGLLIFSPDARLELMNATSGDPEALATGTIAHILDHSEATARAEAEAERDHERARREEAESRIAAEQERARTEAERFQSLAAAHERRLEKWSRHLAGGASWIAFTLCALILLAAFAVAADGLFPASWSKLIPLGSALLFLLALGSLASLLNGWNLLAARRWLAGVLHRPSHRLIRRCFSEPEACEQQYEDERD